MKVSQVSPDESGIVSWPGTLGARSSVVTIGVFDGMHQGHQALLRRVVELAAKGQDRPMALVFDPSPKLVHSYADSHDMVEPPSDLIRHDSDQIMPMEERLRLMAQLGLEQVVVVRYTLAFAAKSYRFFLKQLTERLAMRTLVLGRDARMGAGRSGDIGAIGALADTGLFNLEVVDDQGPGDCTLPDADGLERHQVRAWSSTHLRQLIQDGDVDTALDILGRPHMVQGTVVHGEQRGRRLGFPTANLASDSQGMMPADGVYAGWLVDLGLPMDPMATPEGREGRLAQGSPWRMPAAISIGTKETFLAPGEHMPQVLEANAVRPDWVDLYGHRVRVEFLSRLRGQHRYAGEEPLKRQLALDADRTLELTKAAERAFTAN
ncbi:MULTISPECIES: bifunctional riboflavin kinase/FMN adenylyltransferase [Bifidobacterium]|uniref:Bifunctional riboflavin kinase/FMN adenylyltransferase n=1 Tax=Bifidobacterium apousia TaxID=2750996 RepID=A0A556R5V4_9BIFI|nr:MULTISPECIES: riboflavin kinase [Bifidobacterium]MBI0137076.1 bifunctional riboflavin kinase/FMN adenylyltransferase [Bifidobacterium sp. W8120]TSJ84261.1 bifunctional riboflavin kinase/FMN adenylyltransferase [Bifidobacterium apousia]